MELKECVPCQCARNIIGRQLIRMKFKNPNILNVDCSNCGKELEAYFNESYDGTIKETILCANCAKGEWEI